jgi:hypothetical protein
VLHASDYDSMKLLEAFCAAASRLLRPALAQLQLTPHHVKAQCLSTRNDGVVCASMSPHTVPVCHCIPTRCSIAHKLSARSPSPKLDVDRACAPSLAHGRVQDCVGGRRLSRCGGQGLHLELLLPQGVLGGGRMGQAAKMSMEISIQQSPRLSMHGEIGEDVLDKCDPYESCPLALQQMLPDRCTDRTT